MEEVNPRDNGAIICGFQTVQNQELLVCIKELSSLKTMLLILLMEVELILDFYFVNADPDSTLLRLYHTNGTIDGTSKFENLNATYINSFFTYKNKLYTFNVQNGNLYTLHGKNIHLVINKLNTKVSIGSPMIFNDSLFFIGTHNSDINDF